MSPTILTSKIKNSKTIAFVLLVLFLAGYLLALDLIIGTTDQKAGIPKTSKVQTIIKPKLAATISKSNSDRSDINPFKNLSPTTNKIDFEKNFIETNKKIEKNGRLYFSKNYLVSIKDILLSFDNSFYKKGNLSSYSWLFYFWTIFFKRLF